MGDHKRDTMLANFAISGGPQVSAAMNELLAERDRLRTVVEDVVEYAMPIDEDDDGYRITAGVIQQAVEALQGAGQLDGSPVMGVVKPPPPGQDAWIWTCACGTQTALTRCSVCGWTRPMPPIDDTVPMRDYVTPEEMGNPDWYPPDNWRLG